MAALPYNDFMDRRGRFRKAVSRLFPQMRTDNRTGKPVADMNFTGFEPRVQYPRLALPYWAMYETLNLCAPAKTISNQLVSECFRNRGEWKHKFEVKCLQCGLEMKAFPKDGLCKRRSCRATVMIGKELPGVFGYAPDDDELSFFNNGRSDSEWKGIHRVNKAGMSWWQLMRVLAQDLCTSDDMYLVCVKKYHLTADGKIFAEPLELVRGHPNVIRIVGDDYGNRGGLYYQCPLHRSKVYQKPNTQTNAHTSAYDHKTPQDQDSYEGWTVPAEVLADTSGTCPVFEAGLGKVCGQALRNIHAVATDSGGAAPKQYYFEDECLHKSYFSPGVLYGISPVVTLFREMRSLIKMAEYIQTYFEKRRIPRGIVAVNTPRKENIKLLKQEINREADDNQQDIPFLAVEGSNQKGWIEFIPFADKISEMEYVEVRTEMRETIGAFYGVSPIFQGDMSQGGGLNNEGLQITVTNRSIEEFQRLWNEEVFPWVAKQFGIKDHEFKLEPSEEKDLAHEYQLELLKQQVSDGKLARGLRFTHIDEEGEYVHDEKPDPYHASQLQFGDFAEMAAMAQVAGATGGGDPSLQGQMPGGVQPGGSQPNPVGMDKQKSLTGEMEDGFEGEPSKTDGNGVEEDMF